MRRWTGGLALAALLLVLFAPAAAAKSLRITEVDVVARLDPNGEMRVVETLTYAFDGEFRSAGRGIPPGPYRLSGFSVQDEEGRPLRFEGEPHQLTWRFDARNEVRTFRIAYTVSGFLRLGSDVADLRWQWLGPQHPGVGSLDADLFLPDAAAGDPGLRAWGHGPLSGEVLVEGNRVHWESQDVPAGVAVAGRVAVPREALDLGAGPAPILPAIEAEEAAREAEAGRRRASPRVVPVDPARIAELNRWFALVPLVGWIIFLLMWREWGREPQVQREVARYVREPPDDPPALVGPLMENGMVDSRAVSATIVDLAQRGAIDITEQSGGPEGWVLRRGIRPAGLVAFESRLLDRLFAEGDTITGEQIARWAREHPESASRWWASFCTMVQDELRRRHYVDEGPTFPFLVNVFVGFLVLVLSVNALTVGALVGAVGILSALLQMGATLALGRRTPAGAQRLAEWKAFRRFLLDFSNLREAPVGHVNLWERYLVYSVALGLSPEVAKGIAMKLPADAEGAFAAWFQTSRPGGLHRFGVQVGAAGRLLGPAPSGARPGIG